MANVWGIASITVLYLLKPFFDKIVVKIPKWLTNILIFLIIIDTIFTFLN